MADTLKNFLVSIGFAVDASSQARVEAAVKKTEGKITKVTQDEGEKRKKVDTKAAVDRYRAGDEEAKKVVARNAMIVKDAAKHITQIRGLVSGVAEAAGIGVGVFAATGFIRSVLGTAQSFSRLQMESQRTGASPKNIERVVYALGQMGVDKGAARGSLDSFSNALKTSPGLKNMLSGNGIDVSGDDAQIYAQLGKYFNSMSPAVAINRAGSLGIDRDSMISLEKQAELRAKMGEYDGASMGLDPDKAAKDAREFQAAYDKLATDIGNTQSRINETFFKPLTAGMTGLSTWLEQNRDGVTTLGAAFEALTAVSLLRVIPALARISGLLNLMKAPIWLLRLLGLGSTAAGGLAAGALLGSTEPLNAGEPQIGPDGRLHRADGSTVGGPWDGKTHAQRRAEFGRNLGLDPDVPGPTGADDPLKKFIAAHEGGGYNVVYGHNERGGSNAPPKPITDMTIAEVLAYQHEMRTKNGTAAWPVGRGQWVESTLRAMTKGMDPSTKLTPDLQERLFDRSIAGRMGQGATGFRNEWDSLRGVSDADINAAISAHRGYTPHPAVAAAHAALRTMSGSYVNPDGSSTMSNYDPKTGMVTAPGDGSTYGGLDRGAFATKTPFGALNAGAFKSPPLGGAGGDTHVGGDNHFTQNVTINGVQNPSEMAAALKGQAGKGASILRNMQGNSQ